MLSMSKEVPWYLVRHTFFLPVTYEVYIAYSTQCLIECNFTRTMGLFVPMWSELEVRWDLCYRQRAKCLKSREDLLYEGHQIISKALRWFLFNVASYSLSPLILFRLLKHLISQMLGVKRIERVLPTGTSLTVVGEVRFAVILNSQLTFQCNQR